MYVLLFVCLLPCCLVGWLDRLIVCVFVVFVRLIVRLFAWWRFFCCFFFFLFVVCLFDYFITSLFARSVVGLFVCPSVRLLVWFACVLFWLVVKFFFRLFA